ncbi:hypothetical protein [Natrialba taiwanensis]|uniref:Uncharacterized protein n=1 Tax=Natrialba taiwanensis DSM 12281 TaxID=1230458 RepID=L9ZV59_9EURY|nr:hypothetical protein [Natrialba taiwanensis]ELY89966.1 hypothetical protein C484_13236 [Natrialba taiwanensis DSM 12281]
MTDGERTGISRRTVLRASGTAAAVPVLGTNRASADETAAPAPSPALPGDCPDATVEPSMTHCEGTTMEGCADDHPATTELQSAVRETLAETYPTVGALLDAGFKPYFDTLDVTEENGYAHWLSPEFIGDETVLDPERPESVLVDTRSWRAIGVMFIATRNGEAVEPMAVYDSSEGRCSPWHAHTGLPGRFAWWYYRHVYEGTDDIEFSLPCRTPCMLHVWAVDHPEGVYAHDAPPASARDRESAADAGFETDADPGADELGWEVLPDAVTPDRLPDEIPLLN